MKRTWTSGERTGYWARVTAAELRTTVPRSLHFVTEDVIFQVSERSSGKEPFSRS